MSFFETLIGMSTKCLNIRLVVFLVEAQIISIKRQL